MRSFDYQDAAVASLVLVKLPDSVYEAFSYSCMRSSATSVCDPKLLVYAALSYQCMRPEATSECGLKLLVYEALHY